MFFTQSSHHWSVVRHECFLCFGKISRRKTWILSRIFKGTVAYYRASLAFKRPLKDIVCTMADTLRLNALPNSAKCKVWKYISIEKCVNEFLKWSFWLIFFEAVGKTGENSKFAVNTICQQNVYLTLQPAAVGHVAQNVHVWMYCFCKSWNPSAWTPQRNWVPNSICKRMESIEKPGI